jgi:transcriptional regulator with XRE-family HTH domain
VSVARQFGTNLAGQRQRAGISQEELGIRADVHRTEISQLERGLRVPRLDTIVKLRDVLGVATDELIAGIAWHPASISPGGFVKRDRS